MVHILNCGKTATNRPYIYNYATTVPGNAG